MNALGIVSRGVCAGVVSFASTWILLALARRSAWTDDGSDAPDRKRQKSAVPLVGGTAIFGALILVQVCTATWGGRELLAFDPAAWIVSSRGFEALYVWVALSMAFAVGLLDDLLPRGLGPLAKLLGQALAGIALARAGDDGFTLRACLVVIGAVMAQNALNTFDNADGAATSVATLGLCVAGAVAGGATLGFLPFNLGWRDPRTGAAPRAYLGDSGSHLLGLLLFATAGACGALYLPAIDLARVCIVRARAGDRVWRGDRRHLAHRMEAAGRSPASIAALLVVCSAPATIGAAVSSGPGGPGLGILVGCGLTTLFFRQALSRHPARA